MSDFDIPATQHNPQTPQNETPQNEIQTETPAQPAGTGIDVGTGSPGLSHGGGVPGRNSVARLDIDAGETLTLPEQPC